MEIAAANYAIEQVSEILVHLLAKHNGLIYKDKIDEIYVILTSMRIHYIKEDVDRTKVCIADHVLEVMKVIKGLFEEM